MTQIHNSDIVTVDLWEFRSMSRIETVHQYHFFLTIDSGYLSKALKQSSFLVLWRNSVTVNLGHYWIISPFSLDFLFQC